VLVIPEDFFFGSRVEGWKGVHPMQNVFKLTRQNAAAPPAPHPLPSLGQRIVNGFSQRLASLSRNFAGKALGSLVLNTQWHSIPSSIIA
jgi:hypothetical protein